MRTGAGNARSHPSCCPSDRAPVHPFIHPVPAGRVPAGGTPGSAGAGWGLVDVITIAASTPADAGGVATLTFTPVDAGERWQLQRAVSACSASSPKPQLRLYVNDAGDQRNLRSGTSVAAFDEAEYPLGLWLYEGDALIAVFTGAAVGAVASLSIQYQLWRRSS